MGGLLLLDSPGRCSKMLLSRAIRAAQTTGSARRLAELAGLAQHCGG